MRISLITLWILLGTMLLPGLCFANPDEHDLLTSREILSTPRGYALGNAMSASASGTSALWHNPAGIASAVMGSLDGSYIYSHENESHGFSVNVMDMKSNPYFGLALGMLYLHSSPGNQHLVNARIGAAVPLADNILSIGVTGTYAYIQYDGKKLVSQFSMEAGLIIRPTSWLSLGVSAQNLITGDYEDFMPRMISAGISAGSLELGLNGMFDVSFNLSAEDVAKTASYGAGIEYMLKGLVPLRVGYRYESGAGDHHVLTAGLGYRDKKGSFGLDIAYQHHFEKFSNEVVSASLAMYF